MIGASDHKSIVTIINPLYFDGFSQTDKKYKDGIVHSQELVTKP